MSLHQYSRAGCPHWSSSWVPQPVGHWATCGQWWTSPLVVPGLAGACGGSGAQRTAPRPPPSEAPQPGRRPQCNSQSNHVGDLCNESNEAKCKVNGKRKTYAVFCLYCVCTQRSKCTSLSCNDVKLFRRPADGGHRTLAKTSRVLTKAVTKRFHNYQTI